MADLNHRPLPQLTAKQLTRFWSKVDKTPGHGPKGECWPWVKARSDKNYGIVNIGGFRYLSARIALFLNTGDDPGPLCACHTCDWPPCVRGDHLFPGSKRDNAMDAVVKGRIRPPSAKAQAHYKASLTVHQVLEIRARWSAGGETQKDIGIAYGVSSRVVQKIVTRRTWASI